MGNNVGKRNCLSTVSRSQARHSFILLKPARKYDAESVAKRIAACDGVKEVCLTSGSYAFVVAAKNGNEGDLCRVRDQVKRITRGSSEICVALNHYVYKTR
jgi:DNA-binding Lrp family transcriptional regulator